MNKKKKTLLLLAGNLLLLALVVMAFAAQQVTSVGQQQFAEAPKQEMPATPKVEPPKSASSPYAAEVSPLTTADCARCHLPVFNLIKNEGGKHKIDCVKCHTVYHAYNPVRQNWQQIMPKCQTCHGLIHGDKFASCGACHTNPHAPKTQMAMSPEFALACGDCHSKVGQELKQNLSKHTQVQCVQCHHDRHGYIPSCMECHKPHSTGQTVKDCLGCHPVHSPLKISYPQTTPNSVCGACHSQIYQTLESSSGKHRTVPCAQCHTKHRLVPKCADCHGKPHGEGMLSKFPNCSQCHGDVHNLPGKKSK